MQSLLTCELHLQGLGLSGFNAGILWVIMALMTVLITQLVVCLFETNTGQKHVQNLWLN